MAACLGFEFSTQRTITDQHQGAGWVAGVRGGGGRGQGGVVLGWRQAPDRADDAGPFGQAERPGQACARAGIRRHEAFDADSVRNRHQLRCWQSPAGQQFAPCRLAHGDHGIGTPKRAPKQPFATACQLQCSHAVTRVDDASDTQAHGRQHGVIVCSCIVGVQYVAAMSTQVAERAPQCPQIQAPPLAAGMHGDAE